MTALKNRLDAVVAEWNLLEHPFYQAWNAGTLAESDLQRYAADYAPFIRSIADGWAAVDNAEHSAEELEHAELWDAFARTIGSAPLTEPKADGMAKLLADAKAAFASGDRAEVLGALYAFEVQQPATAATKRVGLEAHWNYPAGVNAYFDAHANDYGEAEMIIDEAAAEPGLHDGMVASCAAISEALWNALSSVYSGPAC